jgi:hypothetical protein
MMLDFRQYDSMLKRPQKPHQRTSRSATFGKVTEYKINIKKLSSFSMYQQWTYWERNQEINSIHNSLKKFLGINLTMKVKVKLPWKL